MKFLVVGRTGTGKSTLCKCLEKKGLKVLKTYTTRPKRSERDNDHSFLTEREAVEFREERKLLRTVINGYEYFTTYSSVQNADVLCIDPDGVKEITDAFPNISFYIIYMKADEAERKNRAIQRADDPAKEILVFETRNWSENPMFTEFEKQMQQAHTPIVGVICYHNNFQYNKLDNFANSLRNLFQAHANILSIIRGCIMTGILEEKDGKIAVWKKISEGDKKELISKDIFADILMSDKEGFARTVLAWIGEEKVNLCPFVDSIRS